MQFHLHAIDVEIHRNLEKMQENGGEVHELCQKSKVILIGELFIDKSLNEEVTDSWEYNKWMLSKNKNEIE